MCGRRALASFSGGAFGACCRTSFAFATPTCHLSGQIQKSIRNVFRNDVFVSRWVVSNIRKNFTPVRRATRPSALPAAFAPEKNQGLIALNNGPK